MGQDQEKVPGNGRRYPTTAPGWNVEENAPKVPKDVENIAGIPNLSEGSGVPTAKFQRSSNGGPNHEHRTRGKCPEFE